MRRCVQGQGVAARQCSLSVTFHNCEQDGGVVDMDEDFPLSPEALSRAAGGHEMCVWDLEVREYRPFSWHTNSEKVCWPSPLSSPWLKKIRKSGLNPVFSLLFSGSTCFLTFVSQGQSLAHEFDWQSHPAHLRGAGPRLWLTELPRSLLLSSCHFLKIPLLFLLSREGILWNRKVGGAY